MRRRRIGILVAVRALKAEAVLVQTDVRVNVDKAGGQHAALAVYDVFAVRRFALAHRGDSAVFKQNPAEKARILLVHRPNIDIFDQCLIHGKPLPKTVDKCGNLWYIYYGGWESRHAPFISLSPQSYFWRSFARKSALFLRKSRSCAPFSAQTMLGTRVAQQYALFGQHLFLHRLSGAHEPRRRFAPNGR